ncbi:uncharacterized protein LOC135470754 [Liolophura sinensis]|uniref:uncharacterized protein LOC135470754 n=1 Tax=Liolophura sinensis TaxID=3198878 RepID=UPI00315831D9
MSCSIDLERLAQQTVLGKRQGKNSIVVIFFLSFLVFAVVMLYWLSSTMLVISPLTHWVRDQRYQVRKPDCIIPALHPYDESIVKFIKHLPDLRCDKHHVSFTFQDGRWLRINKSLDLSYNISYCSFSVIKRRPNSDNGFIISKPVKFEKDFKVSDDFLSVSCYNQTNKEIYKNCYAFAVPKNVSEENRTVVSAPVIDSQPPPNVLLVGVDSMSRLNMIRQLNKTYHFLTETLGSVEFHGYNKVADNTFVNVVPLLTGKFVHEVPSSGKKIHVEKYEYMWKEFSKAGYLTLLAEDHPQIATFNYLKPGFPKQPTDYYLRPFSLAMSKNGGLWNKYGCFAGRAETGIVLSYLSDVLDLKQDNSLFAYTFLTRMSHNNVNHVGRVDYIYLEFFQNLKRKGILNNTILFFFGDHGMRWGALRNTYVGKMEERLPMLLLYLPPWFKSRYPQITNNVHINAHRLTTPFDIYYTLKDIASRRFDGASDLQKGRRGFSLFRKIPLSRTCDEAEIAPHWCTCQSQVEVHAQDKTVISAAKWCIEHLNRITNSTKCAILHLKAVNRAWRFSVSSYLKNKENKTLTHYQIMFSSVPGDGLFEATVRQVESKDIFKLTGEMSRINKYGQQSYCINNANLKKFCYCREPLQ